MTDLAPYQPSARVPWNRRAASHLLRRAGFAPGAEDVARALDDGPARTVERLVTATSESPRAAELEALGDVLALRENVDAIRGWWLLRMRHTDRPLAARMAVFWHDHFATSNVKVNSPRLMYAQLRTIERHALGCFEDLLLAMSRDPAMIVWLDGDSNVKGRPNENYARELFELFALGVGHYSEHDVQEAARAFTGWHQSRGRFRFVPRAHDDGVKTVLGERGPLDGTDVVRLAAARPACRVFLARKLLQEFLAPHPPDDLVAALAARLGATRLDVGGALRALLASEAFFDPRWYRARIKSPVEHVVGVARSLDLQVGAEPLGKAVSDMGQRLLEPPSVKGWEDHRAWLNSATMLVRLNTAVVAVGEGAGLDPAALRRNHGLDDRAAVLRFCGEIALDGEVPAPLRSRLDALDDDPDTVLREALRLLMTSPEYQFA